jgi:hypothetical protein
MEDICLLVSKVWSMKRIYDWDMVDIFTAVQAPHPHLHNRNTKTEV